MTVGYGPWFPDEDFPHCADVSVIVSIDRKAGGVLLEGELVTVVELDCDRCLEKYKFPFEISFRLVLELSGHESSIGEHGEYACSSNDMDTMFLDEPVVDLDSILQHQVFLAIPLKKICQDNCKGLCAKCGENLNSEHCGCGNEINDSLFGVLEKFKG